MFCAKCGKEIDNDSTFCPFCGQKTDEPVEGGGGRPQPKSSVKLPGKKVIGGIAVMIVVLLVIFGITKVIGSISQRGRSLPEKLFAMSWEEISEISEDDFKNMLDEAGTLYSNVSAEDSDMGVKSIKTKTTESFMGGDCLYLHAPDAFVTLYGVRYETEEDFKAGREQIEEILEKSLLRNTAAFENTYGGLQMMWYPVGVSDKNLDLDTIADLVALLGIDNIDELDEEELSEFSQCHIYKFAIVAFGNQNDMSQMTDEFVFPDDKSYTNNMCRMATVYVPMREEDLISGLAVDGCHDAISGKKIGVDGFKESVNEELVNVYLAEYAPEDPERRRELEEELYIRLYMMENHKFDTDNSIYLKTEDEKRLWYIRNFNWDTDTDALVDLSAYRDSGSIYCAVECNYNSDTAEYFESELDRALYLADRDYKVDTGESFGSTEEKRLWFMQNYSYDTSAGKVIDKEIVDALIAYENYFNRVKNNMTGVRVYGSLMYLDDNDVPDCIIIDDTDSNSTMSAGGTAYLLSYKNNNIIEIPLDFGFYHAWYIARAGLFCIGGDQGSYNDNDAEILLGDYDIIKLTDSFEKIGNTEWLEAYDWNSYTFLYGEYSINGETANSMEEIKNYVQSFGFDLSSDELKRSCLFDSSGNETVSFLSLYDALRTTIYETYEYCIYEYELKDGILTVKADDGANVSSSFGEQEAFEFSCSVSDDCVWEDGNGFGEDRTVFPYSMTPEEMEVEIKNWRNQYDLTPDNLESPVAIQFHVIDEQIVGVYTSTP